MYPNDGQPNYGNPPFPSTNQDPNMQFGFNAPQQQMGQPVPGYGPGVGPTGYSTNPPYPQTQPCGALPNMSYVPVGHPPEKQAAPQSINPPGLFHGPPGIPGAQGYGIYGHYGMPPNQQQLSQGTVRPSQSFNAERDCQSLQKAMEGLGTDEGSIINILTQRCNYQRQQIKVQYKTMFNKDLENKLCSETSGHFKDVLVALMQTPPEFDAYTLRTAMEGIGTDEKVLTEVLTTKSNHEIALIKSEYHRIFNRDLERDVASETSGLYKTVLLTCLKGSREVRQYVDRGLAEGEARDLYEAGEKRWGTDESTFIRILTTRSAEQLKATFDEYQKLTDRTIYSSIDREMSGDLALALKSLAKAQVSRAIYFAEILHDAISGIGTKDKTLIRVIVSRSEIDLADIKREYQKLYGRSLVDDVSGDTSGDYKRILLYILG